jgi:hypothetical protein
MALGLNKILVASTTSNTASAYFQNLTFPVTANSTSVLVAGTFYVPASANISVEVQMVANTWTTVVSAATGGLVIADGTNVRIKNADATNNASLVLVTVNGGGAAAGTYNT